MPSLQEDCKELLSNDDGLPSNHHHMFMPCCFYLAGFEDEWENYTDHYGNGDSSIGFSGGKDGKHELLRLIRRGMGTVFWDIHESLTHVIVCDGSNTKLRNDVSNFCRYHPNNPIAVSPHWIIASLKKKSLQQPYLFPPIHIKPQPHDMKSVNHQNNNSLLLTNNKTQDETIKDELFKGAIFHLVHSNKKQIHSNSSSNSNSNNRITFDLNKVKKLLTTNGGHILSQQTVGALQKENDNTEKKRICYIVNISNKHSYEYVHNDVVNNNTLLSKIYIERLCTLIPVTPIWIETCIASQMECQPEKYPQLFQPLWPMYKLPSLTTTSAKLKVKVSVSGFQNSQRIGLKQMLIAIGAKYTDNMGNTNTHLICKEAKGPKYHKAIEWGLHVVTIDWLYHIVRYGYGGKYETRSGSNSKGCEKRFTLSFSPRRVQPVVNNDGMDNIQNDEAFK